jgi:hypothetical protein
VCVLSKSDPTDHALAAIASILDHPEIQHSAELAAVDEKPATGLTEANGYYKVGPGPLAAIRFRWTVRRGDDGEYYVDETVGNHSTPVVAGPMSPGEAIRLVDARESEARLRYEALRSEMNGRRSATDFPRKGIAP